MADKKKSGVHLGYLILCACRGQETREDVAN